MDRRKRKGSGVKIGRVFVAIIIVGVVVIGVWWVAGLFNGEEDSEKEEEIRQPSVVIIDENAGNAVSTRVKDFVIRLEDDLAYEGLKLSRVVLPFQKTREVDVYIEGRNEYYKLSIDRGSAVTAEDIGRMVRHLESEGINVQYVDIRIEGKAFYK